jgi:C1A family cysteine protease
MPHSASRPDVPAGGHTMLGVGYRDDDRVFIVRNSWGRHWGEGGYCFLPYDYVAEPRFTDECWMLRSLRIPAGPR